MNKIAEIASAALFNAPTIFLKPLLSRLNRGCYHLPAKLSAGLSLL